jgi:hypothetical protein
VDAPTRRRFDCNALCCLCAVDCEGKEAWREDFYRAVARRPVGSHRTGYRKFFALLPYPFRTFQLKPGVNIGDIGKKMGRDGIGTLMPE